MKKKRFYIGLSSTFHDSAIAIVGPDGAVLFAEATERFLQSKRAFNCQPDHITRTPELIAQYCEPDAELVVATTWSRRFRTRAAWAVRALPRLSWPLWFWRRRYRRLPRPTLREFNMLIAQRHSMELVGNNIVGNRTIRQRVTVRHYEHHLTHAALACYTSPFEESACAVVDGFGEWKSCDFYHYQGGKIRRVKRFAPLAIESGSLGGFYGLLTVLCGFSAFKGEEGKVMGLAPYGRYDEGHYRLLRPLLRVNDLHLSLNLAYLFSHLKQWEALERSSAVDAMAAADLAYTGQMIFEEVMAQLLNNLARRRLSGNLAVAGGCALNSTWNGQITARTAFERVYVPSAPADDGCALGAALLAYFQDNPTRRPAGGMLLPFLGSTMSQRKMDNVRRMGAPGAVQLTEVEVVEAAARLLAAGKIVGWIQDRAEFGPRALGNRSILADPRPADMAQRINARVKFREPFRPFAPAILHEFGDCYFENYQESPFMERTLQYRPSVRKLVPGVVHVNGTGRLQTVKREWSETFYRLIHCFYELTGIPLLLNTSFNIMGKPMVHDVEDAIGLFYSTGLDALVIGDTLIEK